MRAAYRHAIVFRLLIVRRGQPEASWRLGARYAAETRPGSSTPPRSHRAVAEPSRSRSREHLPRVGHRRQDRARQWAAWSPNVAALTHATTLADSPGHCFPLPLLEASPAGADSSASERGSTHCAAAPISPSSAISGECRRPARTLRALRPWYRSSARPARACRKPMPDAPEAVGPRPGCPTGPARPYRTAPRRPCSPILRHWRLLRSRSASPCPGACTSGCFRETYPRLTWPWLGRHTRTQVAPALRGSAGESWPCRTLLSWSTGKDSAWALHVLRQRRRRRASSAW